MLPMPEPADAEPHLDPMFEGGDNDYQALRIDEIDTRRSLPEEVCI